MTIDRGLRSALGGHLDVLPTTVVVASGSAGGIGQMFSRFLWR
jgi:hypothetical protein